jgi:hypothetical protein
MNKKVLVVMTSLLAVAVFVAPVLAIGPGKAENNPNLEVMPYAHIIHAPNGIALEWTISDPPYKVQFKSASNFYIGNAEEVTIADPSQGWQVLLIEDWIYLSQESFLNFCLFLGEPNAAEIAAMYPQGLYHRGFQVGK